MANEAKKNNDFKVTRIRNIKGARRMLSRIIYGFQTGTISDSKAKTTAYLLIKYSELFRVEKIEEVEKRLKSLEGKLNERD